MWICEVMALQRKTKMVREIVGLEIYGSGADMEECSVLQGNLSEFVKKKPEARSYYELASTQGLSFVLPEPGFLEGVKTKDRPILKMHNVAYK
jgi:hypothetical protein